MDVVAGEKARCVTKADTLTQNESAPVEKQMARPSSYTAEIADILCERIAKGEALHRVCDEQGMPSTSMVYRWLDAHEDFRDKYARAREMQADLMAAQTVTIADEAEDANLARLRVDARKWYASKLQPKKYGDKIAQEVTGNMALTVVTGVPRANG